MNACTIIARNYLAHARVLRELERELAVATLRVQLDDGPGVADNGELAVGLDVANERAAPAAAVGDEHGVAEGVVLPGAGVFGG